ncbi:uncharacterized protein LOC133652140 [Entelurus aequoreus]|uniref:uncharacterized protein LOC133652140 n=1 Tax=Entelurus aequoreus TaxID=161455 RepID=UPI002B1D88D6|nr:uncharacterized protein LOC133652140 [Entelurus aequoreus]
MNPVPTESGALRLKPGKVSIKPPCWCEAQRERVKSQHQVRDIFSPGQGLSEKMMTCRKKHQMKHIITCRQYEKGCDTSDLLSEAENKELPEKRSRKAVHRLGDSDDSEEDPGNSDRASASQLHRQTPPSRRVPAVMSTQGTAVPPQLPPPPAPAALNMWQTQEPHASSLAYRPTWRGGRMADYISCSAPEMTHLFSLLEHMKQNQEQLILKISSLATVGGQDVKRVTWNILGRMFTDGVSHQINWKGVNNK